MSHRDTLMSMLFGYFPAKVIEVAARLGLADVLAGGARSAADVASAAGADEDAIARLLRALALLGLVEAVEPNGHGGGYRLTEVGELLRSDVPSSMRNYAMLFCGDEVWRSWGELEEGVRTGIPAWEKLFGSVFGPSRVRPEFAAMFNEAMAEGTRVAAPGVLDVVDFSRFRAVVDVGGGKGILLAAILAAHPGLHGVLLDLAEPLRDAPRVLADAGVAERCDLCVGDFFADVPAGADAYLMKSVIHDWNDERAAAILATCRRRMAPEATLLLVEPVLRDTASGDELFRMVYSDLNMLVCTGGRERTAGEFGALLSDAGFDLRTVAKCPPPTNYSVLTATVRVP